MTPADEPEIPLEAFDSLYAHGDIRLTGFAEATVVSADRRWLEDIIEHIDAIGKYTAHGRAVFDDSDEPVSDGVQMRLVKIAHAVSELSDEAGEALGKDLISAIAGMRNRLAHNYRDTDQGIVWNTATRDLPNFRVRVVQLLETSGF